MNNDGRPFTRIRTGAFYIYKCLWAPWEQEQLSQISERGIKSCVPDTDGDGLPDNWEKYYGLDPLNDMGIHGAMGDPDFDALLNGWEFFFGTDPFNPDSDYGGQADISEIYNSQNPLDPGDDIIKKFPMVRILPGNNSVLFLMPNASYGSYSNLAIFRSLDPLNGYSLVSSGPYSSLEVFNDTTVSNYITYYYKFLANSTTASIWTFSKIYKVIPKLNVLAPEASIQINNGNKTTKSNLVTVQVIISPNDETPNKAFPSTHMRIGQSASSVLKASWIPFNPQFPVLFPNITGVHFVFVQLKDNQIIPEISPLFSAGIKYTGEEPSSIGMETFFTLFMITVDFAVITVLVYRKKRKQLKIKKFE